MDIIILPLANVAAPFPPREDTQRQSYGIWPPGVNQGQVLWRVVGFQKRIFRMHKSDAQECISPMSSLIFISNLSLPIQDPDRHIVFVGHSYGGIIIKSVSINMLP